MEETNKDTYYLLPHSLSFGELKLLWLKQRSAMTYMKNVKGNRHPITSKGNKNEYQTWSPIIQPVSEVLHFCRLSLLLGSNQITTCAALSHRSWWGNSPYVTQSHLIKFMYLLLAFRLSTESANQRSKSCGPVDTIPKHRSKVNIVTFLYGSLWHTSIRDFCGQGTSLDRFNQHLWELTLLQY